ncbi:MAG: ABC transporter ATP-binding protein [Actinomycetales bacterium]|nr:ABC transporter ATP-binding protein [Actinomycetales bacterium]
MSSAPEPISLEPVTTGPVTRGPRPPSGRPVPGSPDGGAGHDGAYAARTVGLVKVYGTGETAVRALDGIDLVVQRGRFTAIMGPSGSGKSTLLHCVAGLETATAGQVFLGETELSALDDTRLTLLRRERVGFVFQTFNLLPTLTAEENIVLPLELAGRRVDRDRLTALAASLGLGDRLRHRPAELSGGQQQRVAVARALLPGPDLVVADEPTGNLDSRSGAEVLTLLRSAVRETGQTVVMVTHDPIAAGYADRVVMLADGRIAGIMDDPTAARVLEVLQRHDGALRGTCGGTGVDSTGTGGGTGTGGRPEGDNGTGIHRGDGLLTTGTGIDGGGCVR